MDKYQNWSALAAGEREDHDFTISVVAQGSDVAIVAPHGGAIEPGTTEVAKCIAGHDLSFYSFTGTKKQRNRDLHITSARFDEPRCLSVVGSARVVVTIHGCRKRPSKIEKVFVSGLHAELANAIRVNLNAMGFATAVDTSMQGKAPRNICNMGRDRRGVQLELTSQCRSGLVADSAKLKDFGTAIRDALQQSGL